MHKIRTLITFGAGYVLGARAGRERYDQIARNFTKVKEHPKVQEKAQQAADFAKETAPVVKEKVTSGVDSAVHRKGKDAGSNGVTFDPPKDTTFEPDPQLRDELR